MISHPFYRRMDSFEVISETINFYRKHFLPLFIVGLVISIFSSLLLYFVGFPLDTDFLTQFQEEGTLPFSYQSYGMVLIFTLVIYAFGYLLITFYTLRNEKPSEKNDYINFVLYAIKNFYGRYLAVLVLGGFLFIFGSALGLFIFVIGMFLGFLYFGTVLTPAGPLMIAEDRGAFDAISRSFSLVHSDFWESVGALVLLVLSLIVLSFILVLVIMLPNIITFFTELFQGESFTGLLQNQSSVNEGVSFYDRFLNILFSGIVFPLFPIFSVVLYYKALFTEDQKLNHKPDIF